MYKLVGKQGEFFAVQDTDDGALEVFEQGDLHLCLVCGISIAGCYLNDDYSFGYTEDNFWSDKAIVDDGDDDDLWGSDLGEDDIDEDYYDAVEDSDDLELAEDDEDVDSEEDSEEEDLDEDCYIFDSELVEDDEDIDSEEDSEEEDPDGDCYIYDSELAEDDEDIVPEASTVSKLYGYLTEEQVTVLKRYYLWYSQRLFTEAQKDPTLGMKDMKRLRSKKQALSNLRSTGGLWHYAGFVDMGFFGGGHCTLGHPLRFMHLAWDVTVSDIETAFFGEDYSQSFEDAISSNNCIIFGIKCIADFFEVDSECVRSLQKAQRESLKDMDMMCQYYESGQQDTVAQSFGFMDALISRVKGLDARKLLLNPGATDMILPASVTSFYLQFRKANMMPPKSLVQEIRDKLVGWSSHKFAGHIGTPDWDVFLPKVKAIYGKRLCTLWEYIDKDGTLYGGMKYPQYNLAAIMVKYLALAYMYKSCGWYEYNANTNKDEGGASRVAREELSSCYYDVSKFTFSSIDYSWEYVERFLIMINKWLQHIEDYDKYIPWVAKLDGDIYTVQEGKVDKDLLYKYSYVSTDFLKVYDMFDGTGKYRFRRLTKESRGFGSAKTLDLFEQILEECIALKESCVEGFREWCREYAENECAQLNKSIQEKKKQDVAVDTMEGVVEYLRGVDFKRQTDSGVLFAAKVLETLDKTGKKPSGKQFYYLKTAYEKLTGKTYNGNVGSVSKDMLTGDMEVALRYMVEHIELFSDTKTYDICCSIVKYGTISEKQMKYAVEAKRIYDSLK